MMGIGYGMMGGGGFSLFILLVVVVGAFFLLNNYNRNNQQRRKPQEINNHKNEKQAGDMARERYAKGEISKTELNEILDTLNRRG